MAETSGRVAARSEMGGARKEKMIWTKRNITGEAKKRGPYKNNTRMSGSATKNAKDKQMRAGDVEETDCRHRRALLRADVGL